MNESPYVFPSLTATCHGIPDPLVEVDDWLSHLQDVLDTGPETADEAFDLLALWAKLRRVRPELIEQLDGLDALSQVDVLLAEQGTHLAGQALTVPHPQGWLEETQALQQAFEEVGPAEDRSELAERLLNDLDDAQLVLYAARRREIQDLDLESDLDDCAQWLAEHAELFLPAAVQIQAVGMAMRPDLADFDYGLAVTALKYLDILRAAELAEEELALAHVPQLAPADARRLAARFHEQRQQIAAIRLSVIIVELRDRMRRLPVARAGETVPFAPPYWCQWVSPAGDLTARLTLPSQPAADEPVMLEFLSPAQERATSLADQMVTLHGVRATIDSSGKATFLLSQLLETDQLAVLRVGPEQVEWPLLEASS